MSNEFEAVLLENTKFSLDDMTRSCQVSREWIIARVQWGLLLHHDALPGNDPDAWLFDSRSLLRLKRMVAIERDFDSNPELAALVTDLIEEVESLRARLPQQ